MGATRKSRKSLKKQDHIVHIVVLAVFFVVLAATNIYDIPNKTTVNAVVAVLYVAINIISDLRAKVFHLDRLLEYVSVAVLALVVTFSF